MAYWQRRDGKARVMGYDTETKKHRLLLSRNDSQQLDQLSDQEVNDWVRRWTNQTSLASNPPQLTPERTQDIVAEVDRFSVYLAENANGQAAYQRLGVSNRACRRNSEIENSNSWF